MNRLINNSFEIIRSIDAIPEIVKLMIQENKLPPLFLKYLTLFDVGVNFINIPVSWVLCQKDGIDIGPYTWHHHQSAKSMYPVKKSIHDLIAGKHTGGKKIKNDYPELIGFFNQN